VIFQEPDGAQEAFARDFGRYYYHPPREVVSVRSRSDYDRGIAAARRDRLPMKIRGAGHSSGGQTLARDGLILSNYAPLRKPEFLDAGRVKVDSATDWYSLEKRLNARGRATPVLTDYLHLSVGGTLSVGGIGVDSIRRGCQLDHVLDATVRNGLGESRLCSRDANSELFRFALGGGGSAGLIENVTLQTCVRRPVTHELSVTHKTIEDLLEFFGTLSGSAVDSYNAFYTGGAIVSEPGFFSGDAAAEFETRLLNSGQSRDRIARAQLCDPQFHFHRRRTRWVRAFPNHFRLWTDYIFDYAGLRNFTLRLFARGAKIDFIKAAYFLVVARPANAVAFPFFPVRPGEIGYSVGLYGMIDRDRLFELGRGLSELRSIQELALECGGRPYRHGRFESDPETLRKLYGSDPDRLREIRAAGGLDSDSIE
jgi:FAD/FMN-containing dehydrogenase